MPEFTCELKNLRETARLGQMLAAAAGSGMRFGFSGELGAGKTELVRQIVLALGGFAEEVASPSFVLECVYTLPEGKPFSAVRHWDFYRLTSTDLPDEIADARLARSTLTLVEWPERCAEWEKLEDLRCHLSITGEKTRLATISTSNPDLTRALENRF